MTKATEEEETELNDQLQRRTQDLKEHPQESSMSPQSSPYHPDIGDSNGTVLGSKPPLTTEDDEEEEEEDEERESPIKQTKQYHRRTPNQINLTSLPLQRYQLHQITVRYYNRRERRRGRSKYRRQSKLRRK